MLERGNFIWENLSATMGRFLKNGHKCSETKDLKEFCSEYGVNYDKFMNWQRHQLWDEMWRGGK